MEVDAASNGWQVIPGGGSCDSWRPSHMAVNSAVASSTPTVMEGLKGDARHRSQDASQEV